MKKSNVAFLFGAGAESEFCKTGTDFADFIMNVNCNNDIVDKIISTHYNETIKNVRSDIPKNWYPKYITSKRGKKYYWELLKNQTFRKSYENSIDNECINDYPLPLKYRTSSIDDLKNKIENSNSYIGILDKNFHTIISPKLLGASKFWDVINAYTRAYIMISLSIRGINEDSENYQSEIEYMLKDPKKNYFEMIKSIESTNKGSYYLTIRDVFEGRELPYVITTNYTPIVETIMQYGKKAEKQIAKVHGSVRWFESPYYLQAIDVLDYNFQDKYKSDVNFPYMFIQSAVKPIVEWKQLGEYSKMLKFLNEVNILIIIGYEFNFDDNHINSLLQHFLMIKDKKIIYFYYNDSSKAFDEIKIKNNIKHKIRIPKHHFEETDNRITVVELNKNQKSNYKILEKELKNILLFLESK